MHPLELRNKWNLTNYQLAAAIGKTEQTIKQYASRTGTKAHRQPPLCVFLLCSELDSKWQQQGCPSLVFVAA
ncbi:hypothetical protein LC605_16365 [Nostoc sp. CHAB 5836]|jgi:hypothetical protein|uniref:hypothetical protein n=1 Tax=Nostoc sp. CHAB 5836 TaxID=2780404 RepID=UPI001E609A09|nr:hypothetical protein [Nostoc sp. CHAB 5836]MCC5616617.1 hypothetical protein [Nostoc sp. CHAB 5836]